ncbi:hypothetical protein SEA_YDN12_64 [Streptomyces phage YDN12]|uniref:Uncharacterized protein n=1 Tax=Streptomyces phage YDN12 TaxID=1636183 RepID=A0A0E3M137_9CAUD|nr:hypothetical protein AVT63_gp63 [Streptomyces phage YDN12]AKA61731.1 hypothetical protein SEA_YDN12_64 [Streptomyces phage YDN12]
MRSDQTAEFVATRPYADSRALHQAVSEHNRRVLRAQRSNEFPELAAQPFLAVSAGTVMHSHGFRYECASCHRYRGPLTAASTKTHDILNRSGEHLDTVLCAHCWGRLLKDGTEREPAYLTR